MSKEQLWWDKSITLVEGCTPVSAACANCWSAAMASRFKNQPTTNGHFNGQIKTREDRLHEIIDRKKPTRWVIWNDLGHKKVSPAFLHNFFYHCWQRSFKKPHTFLVLTKRPQRFADKGICSNCAYIASIKGKCSNCGVTESYMRKKGYGDRPRRYDNNIWFGVTCENQATADERIPILLQIPAAVRFVSIEPMLGEIWFNPIHFHYKGGIHWVIVGCESGPNRRSCKIEWVRDLVKQCKAANVPVFVKQLNINDKVEHDISKFPKDLQLRQYPERITNER